MSADQLLSRLDGVRATGSGRWLARCPAHDDRSPSLSIREMPDGRTLIHCFAQCSVEEVLSSIGMNFDALFPEKPMDHHVRRERRPFNAGDVLAALEFEVLIAATAASNMANGWPLSDEDRKRLMLAAQRLQEGKGLCSGR